MPWGFLMMSTDGFWIYCYSTSFDASMVQRALFDTDGLPRKAPAVPGAWGQGCTSFIKAAKQGYDARTVFGSLLTVQGLSPSTTVQCSCWNGCPFGASGGMAFPI
jgi:hypothetical protein